MSTHDQNQSAFPVLERDGYGLECTDPGMALRDYFAAQVIGPAFQFFFDELRLKKKSVGGAWTDALAADAYLVADAMMRARRKGND